MGDRLKVFLSSSQFEDEFKVERDELKRLFSQVHLQAQYDLWQIENQAAPFDPKTQYTYNVEDSNILLLLLGKTYRKPVEHEFDISISRNIPVFAFVRQESVRNPQMDIFIKKVRDAGNLTSDFTEKVELCQKVESSLTQFRVQAVKLLRKPSNEYLNGMNLENEFDDRLLNRSVINIIKANQRRIMTTLEIFNNLKSRYSSFGSKFDLQDTYNLLDRIANEGNLKNVKIDGATLEMTCWRIVT